MVTTFFALILASIFLYGGIKSIKTKKAYIAGGYKSGVFNDALNPKIKQPFKEKNYISGNKAIAVGILYLVLGFGTLLFATGPYISL